MLDDDRNIQDTLIASEKCAWFSEEKKKFQL